MTATASQFSSDQLTHFQNVSQQAARAGGDVLRKLLGVADSWEKGPGDLVTEADFQSQKIIREILIGQFPEHAFVGEEDEAAIGVTDSLNRQSEFCWIVDPLDGTTNFVHQLPPFAVSIGLQWRDRIIVGTVYDPLADEMYSAAIEMGATCNERPLAVSSCQTVNQALIVFSMSSPSPRDAPQTRRLLNVLENAQTVRRLGSAALNFCLLASGKIDAYYATSLKPWDIAAGLLIATEAGAVFDSFDEIPFDLDKPRFCCTATQELFNDLRPLLEIKD